MGDSSPREYSQLDELRKIIGYDVPDDLLNLALTHPSATGEGAARTLHSNQRLEFLGDVVVGCIVAEHLYRANVELPEGELTLRKAAVVRGDTLAIAAKRLQLGRFLHLGKGEEKGGGRERSTVLSDAFEAVIGAIYLSGGLEAARVFVERALETELKEAASTRTNDFGSAKNRLQEKTQAIGLGTPTYSCETRSENGAKVFSARVYLLLQERGYGTGKTKKEAEAQAALCALQALEA
jgi:ribonuclease-3